MGWLLVIAAAALEVVWAYALKQSDGLQRPAMAVLGIFAAGASLGLLALALRTLPLGTAYAAWTGLGTVGIVLVGAVLLGESLPPLRAALLTTLLATIVGLRLTEA